LLHASPPEIQTKIECLFGDKKRKVELVMERSSVSLRFLDRVTSFFAWGGYFLGSIGIVLMTGLITVDVLSRFLLGIPTYVATEFSEYLCVIITFIGLSYVSRKGRQIEVTILYDRFPAHIQRYVKILTHTLSFLFLAYFTYETTLPTLLDFKIGTRSLTFVHTPLWMINVFIPIGLAMLGIEILLQWLRLIFWQQTKTGTKEYKTV